MRNHDLKELSYLHAIAACPLNLHPEKFTPFSEFHDKAGYAGFAPSKWYIEAVYMDYIRQIRPVLDQCMSALSGYVLKWDHSFKLVKFFSKLHGIMMFTAMFTIVNEFEQIRYQAFIPTKALSHIHSGLEGIVASLKGHGLAEPAIGFTDNVASDYNTVLECIPSLARDVIPIQLEEYKDLPVLSLPDDISLQVCSESVQIQSACSSILELLPESEEKKLTIGFDMEWEFSADQSAMFIRKTALIQLALPKVVYLLQVFTLKQLPIALQTILASSRIIKVGRNVGADLAKLQRDWPSLKLPPRKKGISHGIIELGKLARMKNVVAKGTASLADIAAATLLGQLSKETHVSTWSSTQLSEEQKYYAALDAWIALDILRVLSTRLTVGEPLHKAASVGQLIGIFVHHHQVAAGVLVEQPKQFTVSLLAGVRVINVTKTQAVVQVTEVFALSYYLTHHKCTFEQMGAPPFLALFNLSSLHTATANRVSQDTTLDSASIIEPVEREVIQSPHMPVHNTDYSTIIESDLGSVFESGLDFIEDISDNPFIVEDPQMDVSSYSQPLSSASKSTRIFADIFHVMDQLLCTLSKSHSLYKQFAIAFSDTMLVPDKKDLAQVQLYFKKKGLTLEKVR